MYVLFLPLLSLALPFSPFGWSYVSIPTMVDAALMKRRIQKLEEEDRGWRSAGVRTHWSSSAPANELNDPWPRHCWRRNVASENLARTVLCRRCLQFCTLDNIIRDMIQEIWMSSYGITDHQTGISIVSANIGAIRWIANYQIYNREKFMRLFQRYKTNMGRCFP